MTPTSTPPKMMLSLPAPTVAQPMKIARVRMKTSSQIPTQMSQKNTTLRMRAVVVVATRKWQMLMVVREAMTRGPWSQRRRRSRLGSREERLLKVDKGIATALRGNNQGQEDESRL